MDVSRFLLSQKLSIILEVCCQFSKQVTALCMFDTQNNAHGHLAVMAIKMWLCGADYWQIFRQHRPADSALDLRLEALS